MGDQWEIAVPKRKLKKYLYTISLGLYRGEILVPEVSNLRGSSGADDAGEKGAFVGIVYDGLYGDWDNYPHHIIQYATAGTQENVRDASGALYAEGNTLYGHVVTTMPAHTENEKGREFTEAVTIRFDERGKLDFYPLFVSVDSSGNINWNPRQANLENGTYEFYIASTDAWHVSANISELDPHDTLYGRMMVTVSEGKDECEFYLDLDKLAAKFGMDANEFKTLAAQFGRIGQEWLIIAGASSGSWIGVGLSCAAVAGVWLWRKKREEAAK